MARLSTKRSTEHTMSLPLYYIGDGEAKVYDIDAIREEFTAEIIAIERHNAKIEKEKEEKEKQA